MANQKKGIVSRKVNPKIISDNNGVASETLVDDVETLADYMSRLRKYYWIVNKEGVEVVFVPNAEQEELNRELRRLNVILKARQLGFTTFICLMILDACVFNRNVRAGIIAHTLPDAQAIFRNKILYPYDRLPAEVLEHVTAVKRDGGELILSNGSSIRVGVSMRSATLDYLLVSEYGKICARYPEKAVEIKSGAEQALHKGGVGFIESTAEGADGDFYELCRDSQLDLASGVDHPDRYRFHFFPWWRSPEYVADPSGGVSDQYAGYFESLEKRGIVLSDGQKSWYSLKRSRLKDLMFQEYPSYPDEAFWYSTEGAYYSQDVSKVSSEGRSRVIAYDSSLPVHTFWDLGMDDSTTIWFAQITPMEIRLIDYHEESGQGLRYYLTLLQSKGYVYGEHFAPPDIAVRDFSTGISRLETARGLGVHFRVVPRHSIQDGIDAVRTVFSRCWFDSEKCKRGLKALASYRKEWNEKLVRYSDSPLHNWASHGADSFRYMAVSVRYSRVRGVFQNKSLGDSIDAEEDHAYAKSYNPLEEWRGS